MPWVRLLFVLINICLITLTFCATDYSIYIVMYIDHNIHDYTILLHNTNAIIYAQNGFKIEKYTCI